MFTKKDVQPLYDENGQLHGVYIKAAIWFKHESQLEAVLFPDEVARSKESKPMAEPIADWEQFLSYWDFNYPMEKVVKCDNCGANTHDWTIDDPKKFTLKAANLGGLVSFKCNQCNYRVSKKHFKDHICYECTPFGCQVK